MPRTLTQVSVTRWPDQIEWTYDDDSAETTNEDISTPGGRIAIADRIAKLTHGCPEDLFEFLGGRRGAIPGTGPIWDGAEPADD